MIRRSFLIGLFASLVAPFLRWKSRAQKQPRYYLGVDLASGPDMAAVAVARKQPWEDGHYYEYIAQWEELPSGQWRLKGFQKIRRPDQFFPRRSA